MTSKFSLKRLVRPRSRRNARESGPPVVVTPDEIRDMSICSDPTAARASSSRTAQDHFTYSWPLKSFNELVNLYPNGGFVLSERFWSPRPPLTNDCLPRLKQNDQPYLWRIKLYPNGVNEQAKAHISLYLVAIPTPYEKQHNISYRDKTFRLEVFRMNAEPTSCSTSPVPIRHETFTMKFEFEGLDDFGRHRFCSFDSLFPNGDQTAEVDLLIRVKIFGSPMEPEEPVQSPRAQFPTFVDHLVDPRYSDVEFTFEDGSSIKAHRVILATRSAYFDKLLSDKWREGQLKSIPVNSMSSSTFRSVLSYLYTGSLEEHVTLEMLTDLYKKADMLNLEQLNDMVTERIAEMVCFDNWNEILMLAWRVDNPLLKEAALSYAVSKWPEIRQSEKMHSVMSCGNMDWIEELLSAVFRQKTFSI